MAVYLKSGTGRCPATSSYTTTISFTATEINNIKKIYTGQAECIEATLDKLFDIMQVDLVENILAISQFAGLSKSKIIESITDYVTGNVRNIAEDVTSQTGETKFKCKIGCVNKGQNGHYWVIRSFASA